MLRFVLSSAAVASSSRLMFRKNHAVALILSSTVRISNGFAVTPPPPFRFFSNKKKKKKGNPPKKLSKKARKRRDKERNEIRKERRERYQKLMRQKNLHPAAKMKRILSATDFWFSQTNLKDDYHLQNQLRLYKGYIPFTDLLEFPKFHHWTDYKLLYDAYTCTAAVKRYEVVIDADLIEHGKQEEERRRREREKEERRQEKREQKRRERDEQRELERENRYQERYDIVFQKVRQELFEEHKKFREEDEEYKELIEEERKEEQAEARAALLKEQSIRGFMERNRDWMAPAIQIWDKVESLMKPVEEEEDEFTLEDIDDFEVDEAIQYSEEHYEFLHTDDEGDLDGWSDDEDDWSDHNEFGSDGEDENKAEHAVMNGGEDTLDDTNADKQLDNEQGGDTSDNLIFDPLFEQDVETSSSQGKEDANALVRTEISEDVTSDDEEEVGDGMIDLSHALLRHKRVTLAYLDQLSMEAERASLYNDYPWDMDSLEDWEEMESIEEDMEKPKAKKPKQRPNYTTKRSVVLIQNPKKLKGFCDMLTKSVQKAAAANDNDPKASAVGFDVEYCSLELDIRGTLPAMLQLAGPGEDSPIGLVWLDKFPDHGRKMLGKNEYEPLLRILADPSVLKVGVGASKDVNHLAEWWGVNDRKYNDYFFGGITDMEDVHADVHGKSLAEMCEFVLDRKLLKLKQKMSKKQKQRKKKGRRTPTAHWRTNDITKQMKNYAANDAASAIDVWMKLNGLCKE